MKEIVHFTKTGSSVCETMVPIIDKLLAENPDIIYTKVNIDNDQKLYSFYSKKYNIPMCPAFLGIVDGKVQDGHIGYAPLLILESLVN